jgi:hypothetical protein
MFKKLLLTGSALLASVAVAFAVGQWPGLPILGGSSYCAGYSVYNTGPTVPGSLPSGNQCAVTAPAGATSLSGYEAVPADSYALEQTAQGVTSIAPQTQLVPLLTLGNGLFVNDATTSTTVTIGAQTAWEYISGTKTNPTYTFTAAPYAGQILHIILGANLTTGITTAAGTGSTCIPACGAISGTTAGTGYAWVYNGTVWYRFQ